jgi:hypothetical protein
LPSSEACRTTSLEASRNPPLYVPFGQEYLADMNVHLQVAVQGRDAEARLLETIRREIRSVDNHLPVLALKTLREHLESSFDLWIVRTGAPLGRLAFEWHWTLTPLTRCA